MSDFSHNVMAIVLAGGEGKRLWPLSRGRAKPAIPFGGQYRLIDFVLTNLVRSGLLRVKVLTQYQSYSLIQHLSQGWTFSAHLGQYCEVLPAMSGEGAGWYRGSADALYKNLPNIIGKKPSLVAVFGADHIYRMDIRQMIAEHIESGADATVSVVPQPRSEAHRFGCVQVDEHMSITEFLEKPDQPPGFGPGGDFSLVSMGNYIFNTNVLPEILESDQNCSDSHYDIGRDILPKWSTKLKMHAYNFMNNKIPGAQSSEQGYWRDVGTIESYWQASMDLVSVSPVFNLYNPQWSILTARADHPPAKFVFSDEDTGRLGMATDSLVSNGCIISGGRVDRSVLSPQVRINSFAKITESVLLQGVEVGRRSQLQRCIVDKNVKIPPDTKIGFDPEEDQRRGIVLAENDIRVVPQGVSF